MTNRKNLQNSSVLTLAVVFFLLLSGVLFVVNLQNKQDTRGRAAESTVQTQCSGGNAQISFSFTNTDIERSVDLYIDDAQTGKFFTNQLTVAPNQTATGSFSLEQSIVNNGNVIFTYFWIDPNAPTDDPNASFPTDDPNQPTIDPNAPNPTLSPHEGGQLTVNYIAINCATTPSIGSPSVSPSSGSVPSATPTISATPTTLATPTLFDTVTPTSTAAPTPTAVLMLTNTPVPTATPDPSAITLSLDLLLHGLGKGGDSANPTSQGNVALLHPERNVEVQVYNPQSQLVQTQQGLVSFNTTTGKFAGTFDLGSLRENGNYIVKLKINQFLRAIVPGIQRLTVGQVNNLPVTVLITGDVNNDNKIDILDYNILMGCYSDFAPAISCTPENKILSDLNDDGSANQFDYNLLLRELSNRLGQ